MTDRDRWPEAPELVDPPAMKTRRLDEARGRAEAEPEAPVEEPAADEPAASRKTGCRRAGEPERRRLAPSTPRATSRSRTATPCCRGARQGARRAVGIVVSRFNGAVTSKLLEGALAELESAGVARDAITVMPVPGAFELPIAAMALAKTRRYACIVALGCVIRGDTPHFDFVAGEAASGLQLAALETGVPVAFGVLTLEQAEQADDRLDKGAEAVRTGLEMADVFAQLRAAAQR